MSRLILLLLLLDLQAVVRPLLFAVLIACMRCTPGAGARGQVILDGINMYDNKTVDPVIIKRRIGMVFQKPNPFPTMSIYDNVAAGLKLNGVKNKRLINDIVKESLEDVACGMK